MTDQTANSPDAPATHVHQPGRVVGIVHSVKPRSLGKVYVFLKDAEGTEYFSHISGWQTPEAFHAAAVTQPVSFKVSTTPNGKRAWDVRPPSDEEQAAVEAFADQQAAAKANQVRDEELAEQASKGRRLRRSSTEAD